MPAEPPGDMPGDDSSTRSPPARKAGDSTIGHDAKCVFCGGDFANGRISAKEMMFGTGEPFSYRQCAACGSLALENVPDDMARYYPDVYPAFGWGSWFVDAMGTVVFFLSSAGGTRSELGERPVVSFLQAHALRMFRLISRIRWLMDSMEPMPGGRILDLGCGSGIHLRILRALGYTDLTGIDPFLKNPSAGRGLRLIRGDVESASGQFDVVLLNHSLEHMPQPRAVLKRVGMLLSKDGRCVIRIPVVPSYAWDKYRGNWAQLDPPRHLFIPSVKGLERLAGDCGMKVISLRYVSDDLQFWGSEQISKGVALLSERSYARNRRGSMFTRSQIRGFRSMSEQMNAQGRGDEVVVMLVRKEAVAHRPITHDK